MLLKSSSFQRICLLISGAITTALIGACTATAPTAEQLAAVPVGEADKLLVVDCLLPGQIRKLGQAMVYLSARRPIKTSASDCEIRGGEYVAYDRANYATALQVWLPPAQEGDPAAQTYVGEIYEKGLGLAPDYALAAQWYRKAAEQGYSRAQINLGFLYEKGLGVAKDTSQALNWYRQASGLTGDNLAFTASLQAVETERTQLRQELALRDQEIQGLRGQLQQTQSQLQSRRERFEATQRELENTRRQLQQQRNLPTPPPASDATTQQLQRRLTERQEQLEKQKQEIAYLQHQTELQRAQLTAEMRATEKRAKGPQVDMAEYQRAKISSERERASLQQQVDYLQKQLASYHDQLKDSKKELENLNLSRQQLQQQLETRQRPQAPPPDNAEVEHLKKQLTEKTSELDQTRQQVAGLGVEVKRRQEELDQLKSRHDKQIAEGAYSEREKASLQQQVDYLQKQLVSYHDQMKDSKKELENLNLGRQQLQQQLERQQRPQALPPDNAEVERLKKRLTDKSGELEQTRQRIAKLEADVKGRQEELDQLKSRHDKQIAEGAYSEREKASLQQQVDYLQKQLVSYHDQLSTKQKELDTLHVSQQQIKEQLERQQRSPVSPPDNAEGERLKKQLTEKSGELEQTRQRIADLESEVKRRQEELNQLNSLPAKQTDLATRQATTEGTVTEQTPKLPTAELNFGTYYGLIIGNNRYQHLPNLETANNDATAIARLLKDRYGFETRVLTDANRYQILTALNEYRAKLTEKDNFLLYYAGHGELDRAIDKGSWLPVDAEPASTANWISNDAITDILNAMTARHVIVIADSCYSGTMARAITTSTEGGRSEEKRLAWLKHMIEQRSRTVLTSGGVEPVLDSGGGSHSLFAKALLNALASGKEVLESPFLYRQVAKQVKTAATRLNIEQDPRYGPLKFAGDLGAPFFFKPVN